MRESGLNRCGIVAAAILGVFLVSQPCLALVVTEIMYHPVENDGTPSGAESQEFIELYNNRAIAEDISGYGLLISNDPNNMDYVFPEGTIVGGKEYIVIAKDPAALEAAYGITGVHGPFDASLDNNGERVEFYNAAGERIISFRYNDSVPWPSSTDGTGHSIILSRFGGDLDEGSSWAASTFIGGTPGGPDEIQVVPEDPTIATLVDLGHVGTYFKGYSEPSPGSGGEATTEWTNVGFNDSPATTAWDAGASGFGYGGDSYETDYIRTPLSDMRNNYWSIYMRLPFALTAEQIASFTRLEAEVHYDDAYVLYLNGTRVGSTSGFDYDPPAYNQSSGPYVDNVTDVLDLSGWLSALLPGDNVLALQVHNTDISTSSDCFACPILRAGVEAPGGSDDPRARLLINELLTNSDEAPGEDWVEIYNPGPIAVNLKDMYLSDGRFELVDYYRFPDVTLGVGEFYTVWESELGFALSSTGETLFLTVGTDEATPKPVRVLDAVRFSTIEPDITFGRYPDGDDDIVALSSKTRNAHNSQPLVRDIVINEIMYHHGSRDSRYEYIELYNRSNNTVSLEGWSFTDGVEYEFPTGTSMGPHSYLVVANDPTFLAGVYGNLTLGQNLIGPYKGGLDDHRERIRLSLPSVETDPNGVPYPITADEVTYYDGGRWSIWADGEGSSLELTDPDSDNASPDAWAASDETAKAQWEWIDVTIDGSNPDYTHDEINIFSLIMLNRGDVLVDDVELRVNGLNQVSNGGFDSGESGWRIMGNHVQSFMTTEQGHTGAQTQCLHIRATGHGDPGANRINQSIGPITGGTVNFSAWVKRLRGTRYMLFRTSQTMSPVQPPRPAYAHELNMPMNQGTPGTQNSVYMANRGPDIDKVRHSPVLPAANEPIVITAQVAEVAAGENVSSVTLRYRIESDDDNAAVPAFASKTMTDDGTAGDEVAGDGIYTAVIQGANSKEMLSFYVEASDGSATTRFPTRLEDSADVPDRTCLVRVGDSPVNTEFATYRVWMSSDVRKVFRSIAPYYPRRAPDRPNLSNELMDCTFVYNNTEVFYNARIRFRGSPFIRPGTGWNPRDRHGYRIDFNSDQKFHGIEEVNLDNTEGEARGPLQERASYWFYRQMGLQYSMHEYVRPVLNGNVHRDYEHVQKIDGDYINSWFVDDNDGYIHKIDDYFEYNAEGNNKSNLDEGLKHDSSHPLIPETYRWEFEKRSHRENDEWGHLLHFAKMMNTSPTDPNYEANIESVIDPVHFTKVLAIRHAVGDWDSYGYDRGKNNAFYYAPKADKWYLVPWDIDMTLDGNSRPYNAPLDAMNQGQFPEVYNFLHYPKYGRMYLQAFAELVSGPWQTSYGTEDPPTKFDIFLDNAANALIADGSGTSGFMTRYDKIKPFVSARRGFILEQIPPATFEITINGGVDFCASVGEVEIRGAAPLAVSRISVNGVEYETEFSGNNAFSVMVPVGLGENVLELQGLNSGGNPVPGATDSITVTGVPACSVVSVTPSTVCRDQTVQLTVHGAGFEPGSLTSVKFTNAPEELGFDALYVQGPTIGTISEAETFLNDPGTGQGDYVTTHTTINLGSGGVFGGDEPFAAYVNEFAVRVTGFIKAPSAGVRYLGVNSDDGFRLSIDLNGDGDWTDAGELVGEYPNPRGPSTTMMTFNFPDDNNYFMVLDFFEHGGGESLEFFQSDDAAGNVNRQLINGGYSELEVRRDDMVTVQGVSFVQDENTIICQVNLAGIPADLWDVTITPECGEASRCRLNDALHTVDVPSGSVNWTVTPYGRVYSAGRAEAEFTPNRQTYLIRNMGSAALNWSLVKAASADWLDTPANWYGTFNGGGGTATATVTVNENAASLKPGVYDCPLIFSVGCAPGQGTPTQERQVRLTVHYRSDFNLDEQVDVKDLRDLADTWLNPCSLPDWCAGADLDKSASVGMGDLAVFAGEWLMALP